MTRSVRSLDVQGLLSQPSEGSHILPRYLDVLSSATVRILVASAAPISMRKRAERQDDVLYVRARRCRVGSEA